MYESVRVAQLRESGPSSTESMTKIVSIWKVEKPSGLRDPEGDIISWVLEANSSTRRMRKFDRNKTGVVVSSH